TTDMEHWLPQADVIVTATSAVEKLVISHHLKHHTIVCDLSRPSNVHAEVQKTRPDVTVIDGGVVQVPGQIDFGFSFGLAKGLVYACMAETMLLALEHHYQNTSIGVDLDIETVIHMQYLSTKHGFRVFTKDFLPSSR